MFEPGGPTLVELIRQGLSSTRHGYDLLAPKFDRTPFRTPDEILGPVVSVLKSARRALDIGCGTGAVLRAICPITTERLVGLDFSVGMLAEAARRCASIAHTVPVSLVQADARAMPFGPSFDLVTCFGTLGHFVGADEETLIREVARVLQPGGRFVFVTTEQPPIGSWRWVFAHAFNAVMDVRNTLMHPPFVMRYLTFTLPAVLDTLARHGCIAEVIHVEFPSVFRQLRLVTAHKL